MRKLMNKVIGTTLAIAMVVTCMPVANVKNVHAAEKKNTAYKLVWSDEFNGTSLNMNNWNYNIGNSGTDGKNPGWGNNELEYYTDSEKNGVEKLIFWKRGIQLALHRELSIGMQELEMTVHMITNMFPVS